MHPGELTEVWFDATNQSAQAIVGNAVPSVAPSAASAFFNKTECFCFTEQVLAGGETRRMPVRFIVDPQLPQGTHTLTLSEEPWIACSRDALNPRRCTLPPA